MNMSKVLINRVTITLINIRPYNEWASIRKAIKILINIREKINQMDNFRQVKTNTDSLQDNMINQD